MTTTRKATAFFDWSLTIDCPHCEGDSIDLADIDCDHDYAFSRLIFSGEWMKLEGYEVVCPHCREEFKIEKVEY